VEKDGRRRSKDGTVGFATGIVTRYMRLPASELSLLDAGLSIPKMAKHPWDVELSTPRRTRGAEAFAPCGGTAFALRGAEAWTVWSPIVVWVESTTQSSGAINK